MGLHIESVDQKNSLQKRTLNVAYFNIGWRFLESQQHVSIASAFRRPLSDLRGCTRKKTRLEIFFFYASKNYEQTLTNDSTAPLAMSNSVGLPPMYVRWHMDAEVSIRNTMMVMTTVVGVRGRGW